MIFPIDTIPVNYYIVKCGENIYVNDRDIKTFSFLNKVALNNQIYLSGSLWFDFVKDPFFIHTICYLDFFQISPMAIITADRVNTLFFCFVLLIYSRM